MGTDVRGDARVIGEELRSWRFEERSSQISCSAEGGERRGGRRGQMNRQGETPVP